MDDDECIKQCRRVIMQQMAPSTLCTVDKATKALYTETGLTKDCCGEFVRCAIAAGFLADQPPPTSRDGLPVGAWRLIAREQAYVWAEIPAVVFR